MKKEIDKRIILFVGIILVVLMISFLSASPYSRSNVRYTQPGMQSFNYLNQQGINAYPVLDREKCGAGQDFIIQISPMGCDPPVVRSDLLEEQNVPVFCPLMATKVNPLIDVEAINYITFHGNHSEGISGVGFHPAKAAISGFDSRSILNSAVLENIGYAVVVLNKQPDESAMPDFVEGTLRADLRYDIRNAFGIGKANYYLPLESDEEWQRNYKQYGFWKGRGYLKLEAMDNNGAVVSVYRDGNHKVSTVNLEKGRKSHEVYMPGFYCLAGMELILDDLENPDTRAKIEVDGGVFQVGKGEMFLDNKCIVRNIENQGISKEVSIRCEDDEKLGTFDLKIEPKIELKVNGNSGTYRVGERIGLNQNGKNVYLGAAYTKDNTEKLEDLRLVFVEIDLEVGNLSRNQINSIHNLAKQFEYTNPTGVAAIDFGINSFKSFFGASTILYKWFIDGDSLPLFLPYGHTEKIGNKEISIEGFSVPEDKIWDDDFHEAFNNAKTDYETIVNSFAGEEREDGELYAEKGLFELILLAEKTQQKETMVELAEDFLEKYPESDSVGIVERVVESEMLNSNAEISDIDLLIDGKVKSLSFKGIREPGFQEYGAEITISGAGDYGGTKTLTKDQRIYLSDDNEFIELRNIDEEYIDIRVEVKESVWRRVGYSQKNYRIELDEPHVVLADKYEIRLIKINLKKVAKIIVDANIPYAGSESEFNFKIGIEKRGIQLSPEKTQSRIDTLDEKLLQWEELSNRLGKTVSGLKKACLLTGTGLALKDLLSGGKRTLARQQVMRGEGGWYDYCEEELKKSGTEYSSVDNCLYENADKIDEHVEEVSEIIDNHNELIKKREDDIGVETDILRGRSVNAREFMQVSIKDVKNKLPQEGFEDIETALTIGNYDEGNIDSEDLRDIERNLIILEENPDGILKDMAQRELAEISKRLKESSRIYRERVAFAGELNIDPKYVDFVRVGGATARNYLGETDNGNPIATIYTSDGGKYVANLDDSAGTSELPIRRDDEGLEIYTSSGVRVAQKDIPEELQKIYYRKVDFSAFQNRGFDNPEVRYYETQPYKGYPAIVPFDKKNGWYVATRQTLPVGGGVAAYDESGHPRSFWIGNVGKNKKEQFFDAGDDSVFLISPGIEKVGELSKSKSIELINCAVDALYDAQSGYEKGVREVRVSTECGGKFDVPVGKPAVNVPEVQCQDFMSPKECNLLFNLCDPVICPSSRCNLGGTYHVDDVVQSGIIGSAVLCAPNYPEVKIPVCLTGIQAGIDGLNSMLHSYRDCLQESLDSGKTIGICDQINSIYMCEFAWRQVAPFSKVVIPKILELLTGNRGTKGGGEYMGVQAAWQNAESSIDYFVNQYGINSKNAFKARSIEEAGSPVCKNVLSVAAPGGGIADALLAPDSPHQYNAWFSEIPFTTATVPPVSQYKVFYHIYAGKDMGAYFRVYLRSPVGSSLYQSSPSVLVTNGYIEAGGYATETKDFTAPSGYQQLCVSVNGQEDCGFKEVSTSFAQDFVKDKYIEGQVTQTDIKTEEECISGSSSFYSLLNPTSAAQALSGGIPYEGVNDYRNPELYNRGITRACATISPGQGTDGKWNTNESRWKEVGYCGDRNVKCWLDTNSVRDVIDITSIEENALGPATESHLSALLKQGNYKDGTDSLQNHIESFTEVIGTEISEEDGGKDKQELKDSIVSIDNLFDSVFLSNNKVQLLDFKARAWNRIARLFTGEEKKEKTKSNYNPDKDKDDSKIIKGVEGSGKGAVSGSCQSEIAEKIRKIAVEMKEDIEIVELNKIKSEGVADSFEELVLKIAMQESSMQHCKNVNTKDCLYCDGEGLSTLRNTPKYDPNSYGVMQINIGKNAHPNMAEDVSDFDKHVRYAIKDVLIKQYNLYHKKGNVYKGDGEKYFGWRAAIRGYNGWGAGGDENYVDKVISQRNAVEKVLSGKKIYSGNIDFSLGNSGSFVSPIFEFADGTFATNFHFQYAGSEGWRLSSNKKDWTKAGDFIWEASDINSEFTKDFIGSSYSVGLDLLIWRTLEDREGGFRAPDLVTEVVEMDDKGVFEVEQENSDVELYLSFFEDEWKWAYSSRGAWYSLEKIDIVSDEAHKNLILSLEDKDFYEGARIIFNVNLEITPSTELTSKSCVPLYRESVRTGEVVYSDEFKAGSEFANVLLKRVDATEGIFMELKDVSSLIKKKRLGRDLVSNYCVTTPVNVVENKDSGKEITCKFSESSIGLGDLVFDSSHKKIEAVVEEMTSVEEVGVLELKRTSLEDVKIGKKKIPEVVCKVGIGEEETEFLSPDNENCIPLPKDNLNTGKIIYSNKFKINPEFGDIFLKKVDATEGIFLEIAKASSLSKKKRPGRDLVNNFCVASPENVIDNRDSGEEIACKFSESSIKPGDLIFDASHKKVESIVEEMKSVEEVEVLEIERISLGDVKIGKKKIPEVLCEVFQEVGDLSCEIFNTDSSSGGKVYGCHPREQCRSSFIESSTHGCEGDANKVCCRPKCDAINLGYECVNTDYYSCNSEPVRNYCPGDSSVVCCEKGKSLSSNSVERKLSSLIGGDKSYIENDPLCQDIVCARFVTRAFDYVFGYGRHYITGVAGDAWGIPKNVRDHEGSVSWFNWRKGDTFTQYDTLNPGDVVGFYYSMSDYLPEKKGEDEGNTDKIDFTHAALYLGKKNNKHYITHLYHVPGSMKKANDLQKNDAVRTESIEDFLNLYGKYFKIRAIIKPNPSRLNEPVPYYKNIIDYTVQGGDLKSGRDTLTRIADRQDQPIDDEKMAWILADYNSIADSSNVDEGDILRIPEINKNEFLSHDDKMYAAILETLKAYEINERWASPLFRHSKYKTPEYIGLVMAVIRQESNFHEEPGEALFKRNFGVVLKEFVSEVTGEFFGRDSTVGCMQLRISTAMKINEEQNWGMDRAKIVDELMTKEGCVKWGVIHLDKIINAYSGDPPEFTKKNLKYIFADWNAGIYSSRNAAFQERLSDLSGEDLILDGDLVIYEDGEISDKVSGTEKTVRSVLSSISENNLRGDLEKEKTMEFENTFVYKEINRKWKKKYPREIFEYAIVPRITKATGSITLENYIKKLEENYNNYCPPIADSYDASTCEISF